MLSINTAAHIAVAAIFAAIAGIAIAGDTLGDMHADGRGRDVILNGAQTGCLDCGDQERGYLWAASEKISSLEACGNAPWAFRQGCGDYLADAGIPDR